MAVSMCRDGQMPGSGETRPNPVFWAMPTQPDQTSAAAGAARTSTGQDRTVLDGPGRTCPSADAAVVVMYAVTGSPSFRCGERVGFAGQRGQGGGDLGER